MFQINAGTGWHNLVVCYPPEVLRDEMAFQMPYDPCLPGFTSAELASSTRKAARVRVDEGEGLPYWVDVGSMPMLLPDRMMSVELRLWLADLESDT